MNKQLIEVKNDCSLKKFRGFLVIEDSESEYKIPLDCLSGVIISGNNITVSKKIINSICEQGGYIIFCNDKYIPSAITLSYTGHWLISERIKYQINCSKPLQKELWKSIVQNKIENQACILSQYFPDNLNIQRLKMLAKQTLSNDKDNNEGIAASIYFHALFGDSFTRNRQKEDVNLLLNYTYTVLRALVARAVAGNGLLPYLGLKHCNRMNMFPLVDDLIEPFRALADKFVFEEMKRLKSLEHVELTPEIKRRLTSIIIHPVQTQKGMIPLDEAIYDFVSSLVESFETKKNILRYPRIT